MAQDESKLTDDWRLYIAGRTYNQRLTPNLYDAVDANLDFFNGLQWRGLPDSNLPRPVFNVISRVITFMVASLTSSSVKMEFSPLLYSDQNPDPAMMTEADAIKYVNAQVQALLEKFKMEYRIRDILFDAAITGDGAIHFFFDMTKKPYGGLYADIRGEICMEVVDGINVMFGNPNNVNVQSQPYVIVIGRDTVQNLKAEVRRWRKMQREAAERDNDPSDDHITSDADYLYQAGEDAEIEIEDIDDYGKATYIIVYRKKTIVNPETGEEETRVFASKSVQNAYIFENIDTGMSNYPVAWMNWEKRKNSYHGRALCTGILPNQIFINRMFAMVMRHLSLTAFPKAVYNEDYISSWKNEIGEAIAVSGLGDTTMISNLAGYLQAPDISNNLFKIIELAMNYTKEMLGVSDAALGTINPRNTSATIAVQKSTAIPLGNQRANLYELMEDTGNILLDMMGTYYGTRPVMMKHGDQSTVHDFDFSILKHMVLSTRTDVGEGSYWSEVTSVQTLSNLLQGGHIDIVKYLERLPGEYLPQKDSLITELKAQMEAMQAQQAAMAQVPGAAPVA